MATSYSVSCECGAVQLRLNGEPRVRGFCHCEDCRRIVDIDDDLPKRP